MHPIYNFPTYFTKIRCNIIFISMIRFSELLLLLLLLLLLRILSLVPQPSLGLGLLHKLRLNFMEASQQFSFYRVELLAPRPTPITEDQASVFISPRGKVATHFSRLLRQAWVTVGLFVFPGHHTGIWVVSSLHDFRPQFIFIVIN
jgi:hypothetical protein